MSSIEQGAGSDDGGRASAFSNAWEPSALEISRRKVRKKQNQRNTLIAIFSTVVVLGTLITLLVTSPGFKSLTDTFLLGPMASKFYLK